MKCQKCKDTGVIETGNNDIPCVCPEGDTAIFNDAELGAITGKQLKKKLGFKPAKLPPILQETDKFARWIDTTPQWIQSAASSSIVFQAMYYAWCGAKKRHKKS